MHLYFLTRGIKQQRDIFVKFMETQMFVWKRKNLQTGQEEICQVQGALRPVELWEYVFPEEVLPEVLTMLDLTGNNDYNDGFKRKFNRTKLAILRKMLGASKIPKCEPVITNRYIEKHAVAIHPIGIKKDKNNDFLGYNQEML